VSLPDTCRILHTELARLIAVWICVSASGKLKTRRLYAPTPISFFNWNQIKSNQIKMETVKTTNKSDFFSTLTKLKSEGRQQVVSDKMRSPRAFNYFMFNDSLFIFISKKEYEFWNR